MHVTQLEKEALFSGEDVQASTLLFPAEAEVTASLMVVETDQQRVLDVDNAMTTGQFYQVPSWVG
jgi:hypothetical protein